MAQNSKTKGADTVCIDFLNSMVPERPMVAHVSRGTILSGVLQGTCGYESVPVMTDTPASDVEPAIDYDPANDQRLDKFDAIEMGIEEIDKRTPTQLPDGQIEPGTEKKE